MSSSHLFSNKNNSLSQKRKFDNLFPRRIALQYQESLLVFELVNCINKKKYHFKIKFNEKIKEKNEAEILTCLRKRYQFLFSNGFVKDKQLSRLLSRLKQHVLTTNFSQIDINQMKQITSNVKNQDPLHSQRTLDNKENWNINSNLHI